IGLTDAHGTGINALALWEIPEELISGFHVSHVNGIRVGEQHQTVVFRQLFEHLYWMDGLRIECQIPGRSELCKVERNAQPLAEMEMPIVRGDAAFLPIAPARIFFDGGPQ